MLMKSTMVILIATFALAACSTSDSPSEKRKPKFNKVYEPEVGVVCDRIEQACYDGEGPTVAGTEKYLGPDAARKFQREIDRVGASNIKTIEFSDGVVCSYKSQLCRKIHFPDSVAPHHTKALFGAY